MEYGNATTPNGNIMTKRILFLLPVLLAGCSADEAKHISYDTLQNVGQMRCQKNPTADCPKQEGYDDYQKLRKATESR